MLNFTLAPYCGNHERYTWLCPIPAGLTIPVMSKKFADAGMNTRLSTTTLVTLISPDGPTVMIRGNRSEIMITVPMTVPLEDREPMARNEQARMNAALSATAPVPTTTVHVPFFNAELAARIKDRKKIIQDYYLADSTPWAVGYSAGKDSTFALSLVWEALAELKPEQRTKTIWVNCTDTMVENPAVSRMATESLALMDEAALEQGLPIRTIRLYPALKDSFWVTLLGLGYAAPRPLFQWCQSRLKIRPANLFVLGLIAETGRVIQVLGTRKAESTRRAGIMEKHEHGRIRPFMSPNGSLKLKGGKPVLEDEDEIDALEAESEDLESNLVATTTEATEAPAMIFSCIEDFTTEDVWDALTIMKSPWGYDHARVTAMYASATDASECPMAIDKKAKVSCGKSRFGCAVCTIVKEEKSLTSFIANEPEAYGWLQPLLEFRNSLSPRESEVDEGWSDAKDRSHFRVTKGEYYLRFDKGKLVRGRYLQSWREEKLAEILRAQVQIRATGPEWMQDWEIIRLNELEAIREHWLTLWAEAEDSLPRIYEEATGQPYPGPARKPIFKNAPAIIAALRVACEDEAKALGVDYRLLFDEAREMMVAEARRKVHRAVSRKNGVSSAQERVTSAADVLHRHRVHHDGEATTMAQREESRKASLKRVDILPSLRSCGSDFSCFAKRNGGASTLPRSRPRPGARPVPLTPT